MVLNWVTPYHQLFPNNSLFPIKFKVFGCTCFVRDVRTQVSKLDPKSLKCIVLRYSCVQKGYKCYCPTLRHYFVFVDVALFETTQFFLSSTITSEGEDDDLLVYSVSSPVPTLALVLANPPIIKIYSRCQNPPFSSPTLIVSSSDPV